jgi:transcriptional regulator of acetoin/glycerol metabolism
MSRVSLDITVAARASLPVLITGSAEDEAMKVALVIAERSDNRNRGSLIVLPAVRFDLVRSMIDADGARPQLPQIVVLREISTLNRRQQDQMMEIIPALCRTAAPPAWRLITTTSVSLVDRVAAGGFNLRLFYLLNAIHIMM